MKIKTDVKAGEVRGDWPGGGSPVKAGEVRGDWPGGGSPGLTSEP